MSKLLLAQQFGVGKMPMSNVLGEHMHHRLMDVFDDFVVVRVDMKIDVRGQREAPPLNPVMAIVRTPLALAQPIAFTIFRDLPDELMVMSTSLVWRATKAGS